MNRKLTDEELLKQTTIKCAECGQRVVRSFWRGCCPFDGCPIAIKEVKCDG